MSVKVSSPKKKKQQTAYQKSTCLVRITNEVRAFITKHGGWGESIDQTLRKLLKMGPSKHTDLKRAE